MQVQIKASSELNTICDGLIVGVFEKTVVLPDTLQVIDQALSGYIGKLIEQQPECTKFGEINFIHTWGKIAAREVILLGLGKREELSSDKVRIASGIAVRAAKKANCRSLVSVLHTAQEAVILRSVIEGSILGTYSFDYYKSDKKKTKSIETLAFLHHQIDKIADYEELVAEIQVVADSVNLARDLVNHPACYMTPAQMAAEAEEIARQGDIEVKVLDRKAMEKEGMHALLAVAQGSSEPPKCIILKYTGAGRNRPYVAFVGKGVTFDSGGISLKPSANMEEMKGDMAGGATVLAAMAAINRLKLPVNIIGVIPCTENMPSGSALKPGDIITSMSGKTIEIVNTDAEGRLILADAITYACRQGASKIVDLATLTGACVVALGDVASGVITNDQTWCDEVLNAAAEAGEVMWQMPNLEEYKEQIKSEIADLKNSGGRMAGMITAGLFIGCFVDKVPWVHIDIAGTSDTSKTKGYNIKGGTGVGVRTLVNLAKAMGGNG
ncbi:putative cytosol aminopeptidase [Propionispora sp. 2/2-37]|uniref:leucyl aminopeptidase n=1 Tax=Propionispora sp. 2/2-37 TaxID=1677858 RepID=UPI0006BB8572|nr:leucyl aminopeptidase [Propionispora sp. 2/2-37]CUH96168.1 putative cytosol aminopeptidase [Propionispora sp. 2/2-37]